MPAAIATARTSTCASSASMVPASKSLLCLRAFAQGRFTRPAWPSGSSTVRAKSRWTTRRALQPRAVVTYVDHCDSLVVAFEALQMRAGSHLLGGLVTSANLVSASPYGHPITLPLLKLIDLFVLYAVRRRVAASATQCCRTGAQL